MDWEALLRVRRRRRGARASGCIRGIWGALRTLSLTSPATPASPQEAYKTPSGTPLPPEPAEEAGSDRATPPLLPQQPAPVAAVPAVAALEVAAAGSGGFGSTLLRMISQASGEPAVVRVSCGWHLRTAPCPIPFFAHTPPPGAQTWGASARWLGPWETWTGSSGWPRPPPPPPSPRSRLAAMAGGQRRLALQLWRSSSLAWGAS